jgi:2-polyprenyl-6-methoxyphenol hydroxylase-like FAD-dependent oxidoreductase
MHIENSTDGVHITLTDGTILGSDLRGDADGIHSSVRRMVSELYYDQVARIEIPRWSPRRVALRGDTCKSRCSQGR